MKFDDAGPRRVWNFDLDGVIAVGGPFWECEPEPNAGMIDKVRELYQAGNVIIIWTARQWEYAPETVGWLIKYKVPFHGIYMGKGGADHYVDDEAVEVSEDSFSDDVCHWRANKKYIDTYTEWASSCTKLPWLSITPESICPFCGNKVVEVSDE